MKVNDCGMIFLILARKSEMGKRICLSAAPIYRKCMKNDYIKSNKRKTLQNECSSADLVMKQIK